MRAVIGWLVANHVGVIVILGFPATLPLSRTSTHCEEVKSLGCISALVSLDCASMSVQLIFTFPLEEMAVLSLTRPVRSHIVQVFGLNFHSVLSKIGQVI